MNGLSVCDIEFYTMNNEICTVYQGKEILISSKTMKESFEKVKRNSYKYGDIQKLEKLRKRGIGFRTDGRKPTCTFDMNLLIHNDYDWFLEHFPEEFL